MVQFLPQHTSLHSSTTPSLQDLTDLQPHTPPFAKTGSAWPGPIQLVTQACKTLRACNPPYNHNVSRMAAKIVNMADPKANKSCPAYCDNKRKYISIEFTARSKFAVFITRVTKIVSLPFSLYIRLTIFIHHISLHSICYIKGNPILKRK